MAPEAVNPDPVRDEALIVTAVVPVEDRVSVCAAVVLTATSPKSTLVELRLKKGA